MRHDWTFRNKQQQINLASEVSLVFHTVNFIDVFLPKWKVQVTPELKRDNQSIDRNLRKVKPQLSNFPSFRR